MIAETRRSRRDDLYRAVKDAPGLAIAPKPGIRCLRWFGFILTKRIYLIRQPLPEVWRATLPFLLWPLPVVLLVTYVPAVIPRL